MEQEPYENLNVSRSSSALRNHSRYQNLRKMQDSYVEQVYSNEEEKIKFQETVQQYYLRYQISKAKICGNYLNLLLAIHRIMFPGEIAAKIEAQRKWLIEYYQNGAHINIENGAFCPRIDVGLSQNPGEVYKNQLLVYGIDLLQTHDIINRFFMQNPKVSWINVSHCLLTFENEGLVTQFFDNQCVNKQDFQNLPTRNWVQVRGYRFLNEFERKIYVRYFTQADKIYTSNVQKAILLKNDELYHNFRKTNKQLEFNLLKNEKIKTIFEQVISEDVISKMVGPNSFRKKKKSTIEKMHGDRSSFMYQSNGSRKPSQYKNNNKYNRSPQTKQLLQDEKYRYSLDYYKKDFIPSLRNNRENKMKARQRRLDPLHNQRRESADWQSKILQKKKRANKQYNMNIVSNQIFSAPLFDQAQILAPQQRKRTEMQPQSIQEIDTSFHLDDPPQAEQNKGQLQRLLEQVNEERQIPVIEQISDQSRDIEDHNQILKNQKKTANNVFKQPYPRNHNERWNNNNMSTNNYPVYKEKSSNGQVSSLISRFNKFNAFGSSNPSSIEQKSMHYMNMSNVSFKAEGFSSNSLSRHNFSSNSKSKLSNINNNPKDIEISHRQSSQSGIQSEWTESVASKDKNVAPALVYSPSDYSQSEFGSNMHNSNFQQNVQGVKRQNITVVGSSNWLQKFNIMRQNNMKPVPASIPEIQTDLYPDNQKLEHFQLPRRKNDVIDQKYQPQSQFFTNND